MKVARVLLVPSGRAVLCIRCEAHLFSFAYCRCCHYECEIEFFASEVERHVENRQFSDAACVFVGLCVFIVVPKRFRRLQQLELRVCRIFVIRIGRWEFFFSVFWGVVGLGLLVGSHAFRTSWLST